MFGVVRTRRSYIDIRAAATLQLRRTCVLRPSYVCVQLLNVFSEIFSSSSRFF